MLKKNDIIEAKIESITNLGFGVCRHGGLVVFISGAVSEDIVRAKIIKVMPSYAIARLEELLSPSPHRCEDRCRNRLCTSCAYKHISYEHELQIKENEVKEAFIKAGLCEVELEGIIPSPKVCEYRNKGQYPISRDKNGKYTVGFYAPKSHRVTEARDCPLLPREFSKIIDTLVGFFEENDLSVYDEETGKGLLRHIYLRRAESTGEILLTLVINGAAIPNGERLVSLLTREHPEIVGILLNVNRENTNIILGRKFITLFGRDYIIDTLAGVELKITAPAFYQVNHDGAERLYAKARELAKPTKDDVLLDVYCGAGSIGLSMARDVKELIGVEIIESAVECARENAQRAKIENARFFTGDAKNTERLLEVAERELGRKINPTLVVLDPPRSGCDKALIEFVASLSPKRVVYISCNPTTLARDCAVFKSLGYEFGKVTAVDMFAMTGHVESVVSLTRRLDN